MGRNNADGNGTAENQRGERVNSVTVAGVDCGTNSIRLMVARVDDAGLHVIVPRVMRVIRLGEDVDKTHRFAVDALARARTAAREFAAILAKHPVDALRFVATSATRDVRNREEFESGIEEILGVRPEVISGDDEAALSFLGATSVLAGRRQDVGDMTPPFLVIDLGGGSTELVLGADGSQRSAFQPVADCSMNIGSVRMTERHLRDNPPTQQQIDEAVRDIDAHIDQALARVPAGRTGTIIGVSGTVTTMSALIAGLDHYDSAAIDGRRFSIVDAIAMDDRVLRMSRAQRSRLHAIHPGRIDVIGGGALVLSRVFARVSETSDGRLDSYVASEHGLLEGIILDCGRRMLRGDAAPTHRGYRG